MNSPTTTHTDNESIRDGQCKVYLTVLQFGQHRTSPLGNQDELDVNTVTFKDLAFSANHNRDIYLFRHTCYLDTNSRR